MKRSLIRQMIREALLENLGESEEESPSTPKPQPKPDELGVTNSNPSAPDSKEMQQNQSPQNFDGSPAEQAAAIGLVYKGWGDYGLEKDGPTVARTIAGKLVRVDPNKPAAQRHMPSDDDPYGLGPSTGETGPRKIKLPTQDKIDDPYAATTPPPLSNGQRKRFTMKDLGMDQKAMMKKIATGQVKGEPGMIEPPKDEFGDVWEVTNKDGKSGIIDFVDNDTDEAHVTYDDGSFGMVRTGELNWTKPEQHQDSEAKYRNRK